jgi:hypothetical protein
MLTEKDKISCEYVELSHYDIIPPIVDFVGADSYLEIGCADNQCFDRVQVKHKVGVDPLMGGTHRMTSDEFFANSDEKFDVIFIDGLHTYQQVKKDYENARLRINPHGLIFFHDVLPDNRYAAWPTKRGRPKIENVIAWNGDVWRINFDLIAATDVDYRLITNLHGVGVLRMRHSQALELDGNDGSWEFFHSNWTNIPQLRSMEEIKLFLDRD